MGLGSNELHTSRFQSRVARIAFSILIVFLILALLWIPFPFNTFLWRAIKNFSHVPLFGLMTFALFFLSTNLVRGTWKREVHYWLVGTVALLLGVLTELVQFFTARNPDIWDYIRDIIGVTGALGLLATFDSQLRNWKFWTQSPNKYVVRFVVIAGVLVVLSPVIQWSQAYWHRAMNFPWICRFEAGWEFLFVGAYGSEISRILPPTNWKKSEDDHVGRIVFSPNRYPRIEIEEPYPDWRGFSSLTFEIYSELNEVIALYVRIHDSKHSGQYEDRFNRKILVFSGLNQIQISLDEVRKSPVHREMELSAIQSIQLFAIDPVHPFTLYLDDFRLRPESSEIHTGGTVVKLKRVKVDIK